MSLGEAHVSLIDCDHRTPPASNSGYPYVMIPQLRDGRIDVTSARHITPAHFLEWTRRAAPKPDDVVLSRRTNPGESAFVPQGLEFALGQNLVLLRADGTIIYPPFLRWLVRGPEWWAEVGRFINVGAVFDSLKCADIPSFRLRIPPLSEQRTIAHILNALDDKIELNQRMNETLEATARELFKSWFVDFDPVRAKAEGSDPGLPKPLSDLFPDDFEDSKLGDIPAGWNVGRLDDVLVLQRGFDLPSTARTPGPYPVIAASGPSGTHDHYMVHGPGVTTGRSGVLGNVFFVNEDFWPLNTSLWVKHFKQSTPSYAFHLLSRLALGVFNAGSAVPTLNRNHVHSLPTLMPPMALVASFDAIVSPMMGRREACLRESVTLAALRDALLPKLVSGELRVKDVALVVESSG
ncbi:MAG: restriction endonuclease subunit S [Candidatus Limnocylindrales bacterium]